MKVFKTSMLMLLLSVFLLSFNSCNDSRDSNELQTADQKAVDSNFGIMARPTMYNENSYQEMMRTLRNDVDNILSESKPENLSLNDYKVKLLNGEFSLSKTSEERIFAKTQNLLSYGRNLALVNNLPLDSQNDSELIALGGLFSPDDNLDITYPSTSQLTVSSTNSLTWGEVLECAAVGIGANALWALAGSSATSWTTAAIVRAFSAVAKRFLGPIGVTIAVVSFGVCIAQQAND